MKDQENTKVKLNFLTKLESFMTYDAETNTLTMSPSKEGEHLINVRLEDEDNMSKIDQLKITFKYSSDFGNQLKIITEDRDVDQDN